MWKSAKCILLTSNQKTILGLNSIHNHLFLADDMAEIATQKYQHLYIINDDVINSDLKIGDYIHTCNIPIEKVKGIDKNYSTQKGYEWLITVKGNGNQYKPCEIYGKIIATTDKSLVALFGNDEEGYRKQKDGLPQISQSFIEQYIAEYNKGHQITDCLIEFERIDCEDKIVLNHRINEGCGFRIKLNQSNEINIKTVKDSFNRNELAEILGKYAHDISVSEQDKQNVEFCKHHLEALTENAVQWIEQNL